MPTVDLTFDVKNKDLLIWNGQVIMSRSEEFYFEKIFSRLSNFKPINVLEIGFGLGISAALIQKYFTPLHHDIIEVESCVFEDLQKFSYDHPSVRALAGDWKKVKLDRKYDFVFYDPYDYFPEEEERFDKNREKADLLKQLLNQSGILCHPHFGDGHVPDLPGFDTVIVERMKVPPIRMADESFCVDVAIVFHRHSY